MSRGRRGPLRVQVTVPPGLVEVLEAMAALGGRSAAQSVEAIVLEELADARNDPVVRRAVRARGGGGGLHVVGEGRP